MYTIILYALRNLWRNPRRTLVTSSVLALGLGALVFLTGWAKGINLHMIKSATRSGMGQAQVHAENYRATGDAEIYMKDYAATLAMADRLPGIRGASPRVLGEGLLAMGGRSSYVRMIGIDPAREPKVTDWADKLVAGKWLGGPSTVVIGRTLAETLEVEVGAKLVATVADVRTGEMKYRLLTVTGVASSENPAIEKSSAIVNIGELAEDLGIPGAAHEIALSIDGDPRDRELLVSVISPLAAPGLEVAEWQKIAPVIAKMGEVQNFFIKIVIGVVFFLVSFGVMNTMAMALLERFREFGILRALGTEPLRLAGLIFAEAAWLGVVGCSAGLAFGLTVLFWLSKTGIPLGGVELMNVALKTPVYPVFHWPWIIMATGSFLVLTPLSALFVAVRAARINPTEALRSE